MISMKAKNTKTELRVSRAMLSVAVVAAIFAQSPKASASSKDGAALPVQQVQQDAAAQGRAYLTIEDLKTLLGMTARDPSAVESRSNKEASTGSYSFIVSLSAQEKVALENKIHKIEAQRAELSSKVEKEVAVQKADLKQQRRALQVSRLGAGQKNDETLGRSIFESVLKEANVEARLTSALEDFDNSHLVNIDFHAMDDARVVETIAIGETTVWNLGGSANRVAKK